MVTITNLCLTFSNGKKTIFNNAHFSFPERKLTFVEGKNGAGKSTMFHILMAQSDSASHVTGTLQYQGTNYDLTSSAYAQFAQHHIARVPQRFDEALAPHLTFQENLACAHFATFPSCTSRIVLPAVPELAQSFHIPLDIPVELLSGGQRQVLAILTMLQRTSSLLLLDEPTATLDEENSHLVMRCITALVETHGITVLMITHDRSLLTYSDTSPLVVSKQ